MSETDTNIKIGDVETFSIVDFPNKVAAVVFMQGCPWRCPFCYNTELQDANKANHISWLKFLAFLQKRKGILDAVVFSGGEPLLQADGLICAINDVKKIGYEVGLHTGGYYPEALQKVVGLLDWVGLDIKAPLEEATYKKATGGIGTAEKIRQSLQILINSEIHFECRTTCDPRHLKIEDIYTLAKQIKAAGAKEYYLQKYRKIEGDNTADEECEKFFADEKLLKFLTETFQIFDIRK